MGGTEAGMGIVTDVHFTEGMIEGRKVLGFQPGNFGFFHIARECSLSDVVNPREIPVYLWDPSGPRSLSLDELERVSLLTPYLRKENEDAYHLVNDPFDYPS